MKPKLRLGLALVIGGDFFKRFGSIKPENTSNQL
jgi:hypothetical protein